MSEPDPPRRLLRMKTLSAWLVNQRIAVKLALVLCLLVTVLLSFLGAGLTQMTERVLRTSIRQSQGQIAARAASEISLFVQRPPELLKTAGDLIGRTANDAWEQETILVELALDFPMFEEILSLDRRGKEIASSNPGRAAHAAGGLPPLGTMFQESSYVSPIRIGKDHLPHVTVVVPYRRLGTTAGLLTADVNLRGLWNMTDEIRVGTTGRAFLVSQEGLLIAHPDKRWVLQNKNFGKLPEFRRLLDGTAESLEYLSENGRRYLVSYASVDGPIPLGVFVELETGEAYRLLRHMRLLIWFALLISLAVSAAVSFFVSRRLVRPIQKLREWSKRIAAGDLEYRVRPAALDELGRLFLSFGRMSERLKAAREQEHLAAIGMAASGITHKLKNAIVSLKTYAQLLPQRKQDERFMKKFEGVLASSVRHLEQMFKNLSKVTFRRPITLKPVELKKVFDRIGTLYGDMLARLGIDFTLKTAIDLPPIQGDEDQLYELLVNLIQNSIEAMPDGGALTLEARTSSSGAGEEFLKEEQVKAGPASSGVEILIQDNGSGISEKELPEIFKPFFSTKSDGMGLGLAVSRQIVEDHGGVIFVQSEAGKGTIFSIRIPDRQSVGAVMSP